VHGRHLVVVILLRILPAWGRIGHDASKNVDAPRDLAMNKGVLGYLERP
jgi:hypothetical protein